MLENLLTSIIKSHFFFCARPNATKKNLYFELEIIKNSGPKALNGTLGTGSRGYQMILRSCVNEVDFRFIGAYLVSNPLMRVNAWKKGDPAKIFWKYFQNKGKSWSYKTTNLTEKWKNCWVFWRKSRYFDWFIMDFQ